MKKTFFLILILAIVVTSCSKQSDKCSKPAPEMIGGCEIARGYYYDPVKNICDVVSGCSVDGEIPFNINEQDLCMGCINPDRERCNLDNQKCWDNSIVYRNSFNGCEFESCPEENEENCQDAGGNWGQFGIFPKERCNLPTSDGGSPCLGTEECEGLCLAETGKSTEGACSEYKLNFGCLNVMEDGYVSVLCVD